MISTLTDEGRKTIKKHPERIEEVNKEIENMGAKVLAQYAVLGQYDFISILEAASNDAVASSHAVIQTADGLTQRGWYLPSLRRFTLRPALGGCVVPIAIVDRTI